ncbi:MAG: hypothetical protein GY828_04405 [Candidatus Gracilibacteria bacterium]|nr:hypothetical protein [Candidatus Gracilibacteria bacterium]
MNIYSPKNIFSPDKKTHDKFKKHFSIGEQATQTEIDFMEKLKKYLPYIQWIPSIQMIGVGNSISMNCASPSSDIDLYIVTSPNRMWLVRILTTVIYQVLGVRKNNKHHAGRFCLSFFSTTSALSFSNFALREDVYLYFWILYFKPFYNKNNTYERFIAENSNWADFSLYSHLISENKKYIIQSVDNKEIKNQFILKIGEEINKILKKIFLPKTLRQYKKIGKPYGIIISDDMLKFHNNDIRKKTREEIM